MTREIVGVRKNDEGNVTHVLFKGNARVTPLDQAVTIAERGEIEGVHPVHVKKSPPHLRRNPDGLRKNNLDELPEG